MITQAMLVEVPLSDFEILMLQERLDRYLQMILAPLNDQHWLFLKRGIREASSQLKKGTRYSIAKLSINENRHDYIGSV